MRVVGVAEMSDHELLEVYELDRALHEEAWADDPFRSWPAFLAAQRAPRPHMHIARALARRDGSLAGVAWIGWRIGLENRHLARIDMGVRADRRRSGTGRLLLRAAAEHAHQDGRTLMQSWTSSRVPAGDAFAAALGAEARSTSHENRLALADVDRALLERWVGAGEALPDYELVFVDGVTPPELLEAAAEVNNVMNTAPRDDLDEEDETITPEALAAGERAHIAGGHRVWHLYARHRPSGKFAGFTAIGWEPDQPHVIGQADTGVDPAHRGQGLGKWLKAKMLLKIVDEIPGARTVVTGNAMSNDAMLGINYALGFRPAGSWTTWELETAKVL